ncbi:putative acetyltransferase At3g50280 [Silene latifolia]|uniref:putative acetyltransferase At3g50280 n=1 Tax=Silene latifolia TaxID=37657 RepID=UPI003D787C0C
MANSSTQIKVIWECYVKPRKLIDAAKTPYNLNPVDLAFLGFDQMQRGLLFSNQPKNIQSFLENLKKSLSISLVDFYPLAGQLTTVKLEGENCRWVYVDCEKGPGARLIHATAKDVSVTDLVGPVDVPLIIRSLFDLGVEGVNYDGHRRPLLSIQVTELLDGVFVGFTMNHCIGDGTSLWHFISSLSEIYVQLMENQENYDIAISRKPMFKPYFPEGYGPFLKLPGLEVDKSLTQPHNDLVMLRERIFHFSSISMSKLKTKANEECGVQNKISSFQALSAFMWRSITRARNLDCGLETSCALVMNARPKFNPPISNDYFGNFITRYQSMCKVGEVLDDGLGRAAMLVHDLVASQDEKTVLQFSEKMIRFLCKAQNDEEMGPLFDSPNVVVMGGSTRFDMYGPEFGLGKAKAALVGHCNKEDGKVTASPGPEGDGSVDLEVCLKPETMNALEADNLMMYNFSPYLYNFGPFLYNFSPYLYNFSPYLYNFSPYLYNFGAFLYNSSAFCITLQCTFAQILYLLLSKLKHEELRKQIRIEITFKSVNSSDLHLFFDGNLSDLIFDILFGVIITISSCLQMGGEEDDDRHYRWEEASRGSVNNGGSKGRKVIVVTGTAAILAVALNFAFVAFNSRRRRRKSKGLAVFNQVQLNYRSTVAWAMGSQMLRSSSGRSPRWLRRKSKKTEPSASPEVSDSEPEEYLSHSFVGSRGLQPSGLTHELRIFVGTWNVGGKSPVGSLAADLEEWLNLKSSVDMYVLGFQEIVPLNTKSVIGMEDYTDARKWNLW